MTIYVGEDIGPRYEDLRAKSEARGMPTDDATMAQLLGVSLQDIQNYQNFNARNRSKFFASQAHQGNVHQSELPTYVPLSPVLSPDASVTNTSFVPPAGYGTSNSVNAPATPVVGGGFNPPADYGTNYSVPPVQPVVDTNNGRAVGTGRPNDPSVVQDFINPQANQGANAPPPVPVGANQNTNFGTVKPAPIVPDTGAGGMPDDGANVYSGGMPDDGAYGNTQVGGSSNSSGTGMPDDGLNVYAGGMPDDGAYGNTQVGGPSSNSGTGMPDDGANVYTGGMPDDGDNDNIIYENNEPWVNPDLSYGDGRDGRPPVGSGPMPDDGAYGNTQVGTTGGDGSGGVGVGGVDGRGANQNTNVGVVTPAVEPEADWKEPIDPNAIVDYSSALIPKYTEKVYSGDQRENYYDTRRDEMLEGPMNAIDRAMEKRIAEINHRFANTGNLGSPAYDQAMSDLQDWAANARFKIESDFAYKAAEMDNKMYDSTMDDFDRGINTTRNIFDKDYGMALGDYERELKNYWDYVQWADNDVMRQNEYIKQVNRDVMNYMNGLPVGMSDDFYKSEMDYAWKRYSQSYQGWENLIMGIGQPQSNSGVRQ